MGKKLIALQIEKNRAHGRAMLEGIANYALEKTDWRFEQIDPRQITSRRDLARYDGFIVRVMDNHTANALLATHRPVLDTYGRLDNNPLSSIRLDDDAIAAMAADCLREHHFEHFASCGFNGLRFSDARCGGFARRIRNSGFACRVYSESGDIRLKDTFFQNEQADRIADAVALGKWLKSLPKPVAVFCCNDLRAYQVLRVCDDIGLNVPNEVAVLGVDNDTLLCAFTNPPLSSIDTNPFELGRAAAALLESAMKTPRSKHARISLRLHPPRKVVERASTEIYTYRTPWLSDAVVFIRRHLNEGVSAADVVAHLGYSHTAVNRAFNAELGRSVQQEIIRLRLERACKMLKTSELSAAAIAAQCGYPSAQYFSHVFVNSIGQTPDAWRKTVRRGHRANP